MAAIKAVMLPLFLVCRRDVQIMPIGSNLNHNTATFIRSVEMFASIQIITQGLSNDLNGFFIGMVVSIVFSNRNYKVV